jgi:D-arabinose 5-phosphate isomerase GutQ
MDLIKYAQEVIRSEAGAVAAMADRLGELQQAVDAIPDARARDCRWTRQIGTDRRKSRDVQTHSFFLHPGDALHGDSV